MVGRLGFLLKYIYIYIYIFNIFTYILECPVVKFMGNTWKYPKTSKRNGFPVANQNTEGNTPGYLNLHWRNPANHLGWDVQNLVHGINYQLVQDFSHQQYHCICCCWDLWSTIKWGDFPHLLQQKPTKAHESCGPRLERPEKSVGRKIITSAVPRLYTKRPWHSLSSLHFCCSEPDGVTPSLKLKSVATENSHMPTGNSSHFQLHHFCLVRTCC